MSVLDLPFLLMVKASMQQILEHGEVKRRQIGIGIQDITAELREAFDLKNGQQGVLVTGVNEDSPAEDAGLKAGDVIVAVDGVKALKLPANYAVKLVSKSHR